MSNLSDYNKHKELVRKLPIEQIKKINIPLDVYIQEVENLAVWAMDDIKPLKTLNYTRERIIHIQEIAGVCRHAQSLWKKEIISKSESRKTWKIESSKGYELRDELLRKLRFAFRTKTDLLKFVDTISIGTSNSDMIQDLSNLAAFGNDHIDIITPIVKQQQLNIAEELSDTLASVLAKANADKKNRSITKTIRDKAFTVLKTETDELRENGKFLFSRNKERLSGYLSTFWSVANKKKR